MYRRVMYRGLMAVVLVAVAVTLASSIMTPTHEASAQVWVGQKQGDQQMNLAGSKEFRARDPETPTLMMAYASHDGVRHGQPPRGRRDNPTPGTTSEAGARRTVG